MIRSFILILCLLGEVLVLSAKADIESSALSQGTEVFVQSILDFDDVGNCEFLDTNENEEETEVFCLKPEPDRNYPLCKSYEICSIQREKKIAHQLLVNLFTNLPPPLSENCQYL